MYFLIINAVVAAGSTKNNVTAVREDQAFVGYENVRRNVGH